MSILTSFDFSHPWGWRKFRPLYLDLHTRKEGEAKVGLEWRQTWWLWRTHDDKPYHTSVGPHSAVSGEERTKVVAHSFLGKIPEFQSSIELSRGKRYSQAWRPCEDAIWVQTLDILMIFFISEKLSCVWLKNFPWQSLHFLPSHMLSLASTVLCVWAVGGPLVTLHSPMILWKSWSITEFFLVPLTEYP